MSMVSKFHASLMHQTHTDCGNFFFFSVLMRLQWMTRWLSTCQDSDKFQSRVCHLVACPPIHDWIIKRINHFLRRLAKARASTVSVSPCHSPDQCLQLLSQCLTLVLRNHLLYIKIERWCILAAQHFEQFPPLRAGLIV